MTTKHNPSNIEDEYEALIPRNYEYAKNSIKHENITEDEYEALLIKYDIEPVEENHKCKEFVSQCCGAEQHEYVDTICAQCLDHTGFECIDCQALLEMDE